MVRSYKKIAPNLYRAAFKAALYFKQVPANERRTGSQSVLPPEKPNQLSIQKPITHIKQTDL